LISINKRYTGTTNKEFNLRHDWNSLLSDDETLKFGRYSKDFFPDREDYVRYLNDFERKLDLKVLHNVDVRNVRRTDTSRGSDGQTQTNGANETDSSTMFAMEDQHGFVYSCRTLIIATGLGAPNIPANMVGLEWAEGYETVSVDPADFEGQSVLILGRGNAAFEVADRIYGSTNVVHLIGRSRVRLSWSTHYVGDLRGVNNALLDTYELKSLDAVLEAPIETLRSFVTDLVSGSVCRTKTCRPRS